MRCEATLGSQCFASSDPLSCERLLQANWFLCVIRLTISDLNATAIPSSADKASSKLFSHIVTPPSPLSTMCKNFCFDRDRLPLMVLRSLFSPNIRFRLNVCKKLSYKPARVCSWTLPQWLPLSTGLPRPTQPPCAEKIFSICFQYLRLANN